MFEAIRPEEHEEYLAGLNRSFGDWGGPDRLSWVLRPFSGMTHEAFGRRVDGRLAAGSIVSYRLVGTAGDAQRVGIMTGSWTDPALRGRGLFSEVIGHSADAVRASGGVALLAFVTAGNASRSRLAGAGSILVPTWYVSTPTARGNASDWAQVADTEASLDLVEARRTEAAAGSARFLYPDVADLAGQWLGRSTHTRVVQSTTGDIAVIEDAGTTTRLLAGPSGDFGTAEVFSFTSDARAASLARASGAAVTDGFLTVLPVADSWTPPSSWAIDNGDRI